MTDADRSDLYVLGLKLTDTLNEVARAMSSGAPNYVLLRLRKESLAPLLFDIRSHHVTQSGSPDWEGKTHAYRAFVGERFRDTGWSVADKNRLLAATRHHVSTVIRAKLDSAELEELGLLKGDRSAAAVDRRASSRLAQRVAEESDDGLYDLSAGIVGAHRIATRLDTRDVEELGRSDRQRLRAKAREASAELAAVAKLLGEES